MPSKGEKHIDFVICCYPRSGSNYINLILNHLGPGEPELLVGHEQLFNPSNAVFNLKTSNLNTVVGDVSWCAAGYLPLLWPDTKIFHQLRDPLKAINSNAHTLAGDHGLFVPKVLGYDANPVQMYEDWYSLIESHNPLITYRLEDINTELVKEILDHIKVKRTKAEIGLAIEKTSKAANHRGFYAQEWDLSPAVERIANKHGYEYSSSIA